MMRAKYKHLNCSGAYGIIYKPDDKFIYIGVSKNINVRWRAHRTTTKGKDYNDEFHKDLRANPDKYECVVLYKYNGVIKGPRDVYKKLVPIEYFLIEHFKLLGHPIVSDAEHQTKTYKRSDETKAKMTGENNPAKRQDVRDKIGAANTGKNNGMFGTKWMHKPNSNEKPIPVKKCDIEAKQKEGYILGRN